MSGSPIPASPILAAPEDFRSHLWLPSRPPSTPPLSGPELSRQAPGHSRRLRETRAGDGQRLRKVLDIEPRLGTQGICQVFVPYPGGLDIEFGLLFLIAGLNAMAGDSPLLAYPINIAMQGHLCCRYFWRSITFNPPI